MYKNNNLAPCRGSLSSLDFLQNDVKGHGHLQNNNPAAARDLSMWTFKQRLAKMSSRPERHPHHEQIVAPLLQVNEIEKCVIFSVKNKDEFQVK